MDLQFLEIEILNTENRLKELRTLQCQRQQGLLPEKIKKELAQELRNLLSELQKDRKCSIKTSFEYFFDYDLGSGEIEDLELDPICSLSFLPPADLDQMVHNNTYFKIEFTNMKNKMNKFKNKLKNIQIQYKCKLNLHDIWRWNRA